MLQEQGHYSDAKEIVVDLNIEKELEPKEAKLKNITVPSASEQLDVNTTLDPIPPLSTSAQYNKNNVDGDEADDDLARKIDEIRMEPGASSNENATDSIFLFTKRTASEKVN